MLSGVTNLSAPLSLPDNFVMIRSTCVLLIVACALCGEVDVEFTIKKESNLAFDAVKFLDDLVTGNYTLPNSTENNNNVSNSSNSSTNSNSNIKSNLILLQSIVRKEKAAVLNASDLLCVNGSCVEQVLELPPPKVLTTTAKPTTTTTVLPTTTGIYSTTTSNPLTSTTTSSFTTTNPIAASSTSISTQQITIATTPAPPPAASPAASDSPSLLVISVGLGAVLAVVSLILYFTTQGRSQSDPSVDTTKANGLAAPLLPPEPHVLRIAIDWPPRAPPEIKTACQHLQGRPHEA